MVGPITPHNPVTPQELNIYELWRAIGILVGFQITVLGWRVAREQKRAETRKEIWFPIADYLNVASIAISMLSVFIIPIVGDWPRLRLGLLGVSLLLFTASPFALIGHYGMFTPNKHPQDLRYWPYQEKVVTFITAVLIVVFVIWYCRVSSGALY